MWLKKGKIEKVIWLIAGGILLGQMVTHIKQLEAAQLGRITISTMRQEFKAGEKVIVYVTCENRSEKRKAMYCGPHRPQPGDMNGLIVNDSHGSRPESCFGGRYNMAGYRTVEPHSTYKDQVVLSNDYCMKHPGQYQIQVVDGPVRSNLWTIWVR